MQWLVINNSKLCAKLPSWAGQVEVWTARRRGFFPYYTSVVGKGRTDEAGEGTKAATRATDVVFHRRRRWSWFGIQCPMFLSDNQQPVTFLNGNDHTNPPQWEIQSFTQSFINHSSHSNAKIFKVQRLQNNTAHILATQDFNSSYRASVEMQFSCNNATHVISCPSVMALNSVNGDIFTIIAASCC
jgi:hypothetical protein